MCFEGKKSMFSSVLVEILTTGFLSVNPQDLRHRVTVTKILVELVLKLSIHVGGYFTTS